MTLYRPLLGALILQAILSAPAIAADTAEDSQAIGFTAERPQAAALLDGTKYAVIAPTFNGSDGNQSYIRLGNGGTATTTYTVSVIGSPSGVLYGTATLQIPAAASLQYSLAQILTAANAGGLTGGDTSYSLYLRDPDSLLSYQHVIYNSASGFFENAGVCKYDTNDYSNLNTRLLNVHTSRLSSYPAQIYVHNYSATAATYNVTVYDAATGTAIGTVPVTVAANATYTTPFSWFEQQLNWTPSASQSHANMLFQATASATTGPEVIDYVYNQQLATYVNMTQRCGITTPSSASTTFSGTIAGTDGTNGVSGTLKVTVQTAIAASAAPAASAPIGPERALATSSASGTLLISVASPVSLSGTYDPATNTMNLSGGGYSFTGTTNGGVFSGTYTGPNSSSGGSLSALDEGQGQIKAFCGTYSGNPQHPGSGVWNMQIAAGGKASGANNPTNGFGSQHTFVGQVTGNTITGTINNGNTLRGTIQNESVSGTTTDATDGTTKPFSGSRCPLPSS